MSQIAYRGNLAAKIFPFIADFFGESVIVAGIDQNYTRQNVSAEDPDKDIGRPQLYYCHNVMPSEKGFQSVGYTTPVMGFTFENQFTRPFALRDTLNVAVFFVSTLDGRNFVLPFGNPAWQQINTIAGTTGKLVTTAYISGQSYVYFATVGCYQWDSVSNSLLPVTLAGLDPTQILGITTSAGYMLAWTKNTVLWSSTISPIDFTPSLITGAGGGGVQAAKGNITACINHQLGFIVYTSDNAVAATYSGNARYPFNYRELVSSGGLASISLVANDSNSGNQYGYTTSGLQLLAMTGAQTIMPEVTDFIAGSLFEDFNDTTLTLTQTPLTTTLKKQLNTISDRYLVISYGITSFTHALVYDLVLKRYGKLKLPHVGCFEWELLTPEVNETPRTSIGFIQLDGTVKVVDFTYTSLTSNGTMLLGKFQYVRSRTIALQEAKFEVVNINSTLTVTDQVSIDGKNIYRTQVGYPVIANELRTFRFNTDGLNHTLVCQGGFYMSSFELKFNLGGRR